MNSAGRRLLVAVGILAVLILAGGWAIYWLGHGRWRFAEGLYMAVISAATVGFSELPGFSQVHGARVVAVIIILLGIGAVAFFQSSLTAFFVESSLGEAVRRRRMEKAIDKLKDHIVVAGCGSTGQHVVEELCATRTPFVVIDRNREHLEAMARELKHEVLFVIGDATHDQTLIEAGIERAKGLIAALTHDRDNLYVTLSARTLNAKARIITKVVELEAVAKMERAGANGTVSPNIIGGRRMVSELIRPTVVEFLDQMFREKESNFRIEEVAVPSGSDLVGRALRDVPIRERTNALVVAVREHGKEILYNPDGEFVLRAGSVMVVLGGVQDVQRLRSFVTGTPFAASGTG